jgi:FAD/FMN-containing dehydrogenase
MSTITASNSLAHELRGRGFTGVLVQPGEDGYEAARRVWSGSIDRRPLAVACCLDGDDVAAAIGLARARGLPLAVRGGGHSASGHGTCDGGIVIDLSPMRHVEVDPAARIAHVGGGALLGDLDAATQRHGLAVPAGQVSHTGVAGLTLGGGVGYTMRAHGLTIDSLLAVEVVTADGVTVFADAEQHPDLFWALRGGGGNFGVVTRFTFGLHAIGPMITGGVLAYPFERAGEVMRASRELMRGAPDELTVHEILITVPRHEPFPEHLQGRRALFLCPVHVGEEEQARTDLQPLRELAPAFDLAGPMPYLAQQSMIDHDNRAGLGHHSRSHWLAGFGDDLIDVLVEALPASPSPMSHLITARMGGAVARVGAAETAFAHRDAANLLWIIGLWEDAGADARPHREWVDAVFEAARPYSTGGVYVNALENEGPDRVRAAYGEATFERLRRIKRRWDPENVFRLNQNIPPAA